MLHWLGAAFDPALEGYWGTPGRDAATDVLLELVAGHADHVEGIKVSLLDLDHEVDLRRRVPAGVRVFTGDDFNFLELIRGEDGRHSDALLGIFDAAAPAAAAATARGSVSRSSARRRSRRTRASPSTTGSAVAGADV